jgi:hypothetical protein
MTGMAVVELPNGGKNFKESDVYKLLVQNVSVFHSFTSPYIGRYPCGSLYYNGTWFYGTYSLSNSKSPPNPPRDCGNLCVQGPFCGFRWSNDEGKTWTEPRVRMANDTDNIFGETSMNNSKVKFGAPHVVDFGRELEHSPDGKMYIVGHGASLPTAHQSWMQGDEVYMARVTPSIDAVSDRSQWEFFAGKGVEDNTGNASPISNGSFVDKWVKGDVGAAKPLLTWNNHTGVTTMTWVPAIRKFITCISTPSFSPFTVKQVILFSPPVAHQYAFYPHTALHGTEFVLKILKTHQ